MGPKLLNKARPCTQLPSKLGQRISMLTAETALRDCRWKPGTREVEPCSGRHVMDAVGVSL